METYEPAQLRRILKRMQVVAMVGASHKPVRPSYFVGRYLTRRGVRVIPVNPGLVGQTLFGNSCVAQVADLPPEVDMIDIFRRSDAVPEIVDQALQALPRLQTIWMQIGVCHPVAAERARAAGIDVVQNRCPKIEYQRLFGELRMAGFNTGVISAKL